jgi:hypothetical protein
MGPGFDGQFRPGPAIFPEFGYMPTLSFISEYQFEKNGLRFPNLYSVTEAYVGLQTDKVNMFSEVMAIYVNYKFFIDETAVYNR